MKTKVKYNKCKTCEKAGWSMPECAECNPANDYRWYRSGPTVAQNGRDYLNPEDFEATEEPRHPFLIKRFNVPIEKVPTDWPSLKKLLDTAPMLGVERAVTELRFCFEEKENQAFFEQCGRMKVDPDALIKTAKKNAELMAELSKQQDRVTRALREIKEHLIALRDGWWAVIENGGAHTSVQLYNHINSELKCLEELAAKYEVDLGEEDEG